MSNGELPAGGRTVLFIGRLVELPDAISSQLELRPPPGYWPDTPLSTYDPLSDPLDDPFPEERRA